MAATRALVGALLFFVALACAAPFSIVYTQVDLGQYFWPGEQLLVTIGATEYDLSLNNSLAGVLTVYLDGLLLGSIPPSQLAYFDPGIAKGWLAQNLSLVLTDPDTNATLSTSNCSYRSVPLTPISYETTFTSPPAWVAQFDVVGTTNAMTAIYSSIAPSIFCAFTDVVTSDSQFTQLFPVNNQNMPGPLLFSCQIQFAPSVIPVGTLFQFGVVFFPGNMPVSGPPTSFMSGAVWDSVPDVPRQCSKGEVSITLGGFFNTSEMYALQWMAEGTNVPVTGPYALPQSETKLTLKTGTVAKVSGPAKITQLIGKSHPLYPVPTANLKIPFPLLGPVKCKSNHGLAVAMICTSIFILLVVAGGLFYWYYKRFIGQDLREHLSLLGKSSTPTTN